MYVKLSNHILLGNELAKGFLPTETLLDYGVIVNGAVRIQ
jgi:hypothetical protein